MAYNHQKPQMEPDLHGGCLSKKKNRYIYVLKKSKKLGLDNIEIYHHANFQYKIRSLYYRLRREDKLDKFSSFEQFTIPYPTI